MKTRRTWFFLLFALSGLISLQAQSPRIYLGAKAGLGIPNLTAGSKSTPLSEGYASRLGFYGGVLGEYWINKRIAFRAEINYSSQGGQRKGMQALPLMSELQPLWLVLPNFGITPGDYMYANIKSEAILNYLEIPVMVKYTMSLGRRIDFYLQAGPCLSILLNAKNITSGSSDIYIDKAGTESVDAVLLQGGMPTIGRQSFAHTENITSDIKKVNVGGQGAVGFDLIMGKDRLFIEGGGNYGFIPIQKDDANGTNHTGAGTVTIGYLFALK